MTKPAIRQTGVRAMAHTDLERVLAWRNHPAVRRFMLTQHKITFDEHLRWFEQAHQDPRKHLLIFEGDKQPLGFVSFSELAVGAIAEWGFYMAPDAPKGCGRLLGHSALEHAFSNIRLHKVCGQALAYNGKSIQFHQALGFRQEGVMRDQYFDGIHYHHMICFGLLGCEWQPTP